MRRLLIGALAVVAVALGAVLFLSAGPAEQTAGTPKAPVPRVCWYSDYEKGGLSNQCEYRDDERRWYMEADGRMVPADTQRLPVANLCLYFHGTKCPDRDDRDQGDDPR